MQFGGEETGRGVSRRREDPGQITTDRGSEEPRGVRLREQGGVPRAAGDKRASGTPPAQLLKDLMPPILEGLRREVLDTLASGATCKAYEKGQEIVGPCSAEGALFILIEGSAYLCGLTETGREVILGRYANDGIFGLSFLQPGVTPADFPEMHVKAGHDATRVIAFPIDTVQRLLSSDPEFAIRVVAVQGSRIASFARQELDLMSGSVRTRLGRVLLDLAAADSASRVYATHEELAQMVGVTRQQVTEVLCEFRRESAITYQRCGPIEISASGQRLRRMMSRI